MWRSSPFLKGALGAFVAGIMFLLTVHAYSDHVAFHVLLDFLNQHGEKIAKLP